MFAKEAKARIKINKLLEEVGWRFFDSDAGKANISLEHRTKKGKYSADKLGNDLENAPDGYIDYLLLNEQSRPVALLEAKRESIDPLNAKEQTREYARGQNIRHVFLSNGNVHYYWDLEQGNPTVISRLLSLEHLGEAGRWQPAPEKMKSIEVTADYIALSQDSSWRNYSAEQIELNKNPPPSSRNPAKNRRRTGRRPGRRSWGQAPESEDGSQDPRHHRQGVGGSGMSKPQDFMFIWGMQLGIVYYSYQFHVSARELNHDHQCYS